MQYLVLGPLEVRGDDGLIDLGGRRQRTVLARLLAARREAVSADRLIEDVWGGTPGPSALGVLQAYVSNLRRLLEPERAPRAPATVLRTKAPGYLLDVHTDADELAKALEAGMRSLNDGAVAEAEQVLDRARGLRRGEPYADLADAEWLRPEVARLVELDLVAREHLLAARISLGAAHTAVPELERLTLDHPLREDMWRLLALALYRTNRQGDALAALQRAREVLRDELGLDPSPALRELEASVLAQAPGLGTSIVAVREPAPAVDVPSDFERADALVGRDAALDEVLGWARAAAWGRPGAVVVEGVAGIGKTAFAEYLAGRLGAAGWRVAWGRCQDASGAPALWPWIQVLSDLATATPLPEPVQDLIDGRADPGLAAEARFRQHDEVRRYLAAYAAQRPLLLVFDDVQWADAASLQLAADVLALGRTGAVFLLLLMRTSGPRVAAVERVDRAGGRRVRLDRLTVAQVGEIAAATGLTLDPAALARLAERAGGNPFFVSEIVRVAAQVGAEQALAEVPASVAELIRQQLRLLSPEAQTVLRTAALLGRAVDPELLVAVCGEEPDEVWDALDAAVLAGVVVSVDDKLAFAHDLIHEALAADLAPLRRSRLHARVVAALEARGEPDVTRVAEHARAAGPLARGAAVTWATRAADEASARTAHEDAVRWRSVAVEASELAGHRRSRDHVELMLALVRAQLDSGDAMGARETRNLAVRVAADVGDRALVARALVALDAPALWHLRQFDEVEAAFVAILETTLVDWSPDDDSELWCRLTATLGAELYGAVPDPRSEELTAAALAAARRSGDRALLAYALNARYLALASPPLREEAVQAGHELVELGQELRRPDITLLGHQILEISLLMRFEIGRADAHAREADRLTERLDLGVPRLQQLAYRLVRAQLAGDFEAGDAAIRELEALPLRWWAREPLTAAIRVLHGWLRGDLGHALDDLARASVAQPTLGEDIERILAARRGVLPRSAWTPVPFDWGWMSLMIVRADAAVVVGDLAMCRSVYEQLLPFRGQIAYTSGLAVPVDWTLAQLAGVLGEDRAGFLTGLASNLEREGLGWWLARVERILKNEGGC